MTPNTTLIIIGHSMSAMAYAALAAWVLRRMYEGHSRTAMQACFVGSLFAMSLWSLAILMTPSGSIFAVGTETLRNAVWLMFLWQMSRTIGPKKALNAAGYVYSALFTVTAIEMLLLLMNPAENGWSVLASGPVSSLIFLMRMIFSIGALMLVQDLYRSMSSDSRWGVGLPLASLAGMWCFELNIYMAAYMWDGVAGWLEAVRGVGATMLVPVFALAMRRNSSMQIRLSRRAAFQSVSLVATGLYMIVMLWVAWAVDNMGGEYGRAYAFCALFVMSVIGFLVIPSDRFRAWLRVMIAKNFFRHRYDYRDEWMRFTATIGDTENEMGPIGHRVLKALCDICDSPGAILLMPDNVGNFRVAGRWHWHGMEAKGELLSPVAVRAFEQRRFIVDLENARKGIGASAAFPAIPGWALTENRAWIMLPFLHFGKLVGLTVLEKPRVMRPLDWEDLDMLRIASAQSASYLAEARGRESLAEVQRFEEFNRRFAFIMHDIKNLVSQLSLLARNAERHADNPEFRADMVETLRASVGKMNDLLARLSQHHKGKNEPPRSCDLMPVAEQVVAQYSKQHPITLIASKPVTGLTDPSRVMTILGHLLQNAIDASEDDAPIQLRLQERDGMAMISVVDCGKGISERFLRESLFKPFNSDKEGGFGIGAYEAQMLARSLGGRIDVESQVGVGSRFTLHLPLGLKEDMENDHNGKEQAA